MHQENNQQNNYFDIIIIGLGANGASTFYHASKSGKKVLAIEKFDIGHGFGSSKGESRATREAIFEGAVYRNINQKSQQIIKELQQQIGKDLYYETGGCYMGIKGGHFMEMYQQSLKQHNIQFDVMNSQQIRDRFPEFQIPDNYVGIFEQKAGILMIDDIISAFIEKGLENKNSQIITQTKALNYSTKTINQEQITVVSTDKGEFHCKKLILCCGIWITDFIREMNIPFTIQKNQLVWIDWNTDTMKNMPIFGIEYENHLIYGFQNLGNGFKLAFHKMGKDYKYPEEVDYELDQNLLEKLKNESQLVFKGINWNKILNAKTCFYTSLPKELFLLDFHPENKNIVIVSPCSGHGFKYVGQIGKDAFQMSQTGEIPYQEFNIRQFMNNQHGN